MGAPIEFTSLFTRTLKSLFVKTSTDIRPNSGNQSLKHLSRTQDAFVSHTRDHTGHIFKNPHGEGCKVDVDFWLKKNNGEFQFSSTDDKTDMSHIIETMKFGDDTAFAGTS